jgi:predicted RNA-binding protein Jag
MVDEKEIEDIKKLPPKERLKRLQDMETKRKRQEEEAKKMIEQSLKEIKLDEMLQEIEVPKQEKVDINKLFAKSADIEEQVAQAKRSVSGGGTDYGRRIQQLLPSNTIQEIQGWYAQGNRAPSREEFLEVYEHAREAYDTLRQSMEARPDQEMYVNLSDRLVDNVVSSMKMLRSMGYKMKWFEHSP